MRGFRATPVIIARMWENAGMVFLEGADCQALNCLIRLDVRSGGLAEL
jgi:hypothetical protein